MSAYIPLSVPTLKGNELKYVKECIDTEWVSSAGKYVELFEQKIAEYTGSKYAVACVNGTAAIQVSLRLAGVKPSDEVIVSTLTFIASVNAITYNNATPIFMDADKYYNLDSEKTIEFIKNETVYKNGFTYNKNTDKKISAILPVHVWGNACWLDELIELCNKQNIVIVEDACESLGTFYNGGKFKGKHTGTIGKLGCLSFNGNKIITTGGGGMILTNNEDIAIRARHITTTAKSDPLEYFHDEVGYNYRLVNVLAAIGVAQMENFEQILKRKKEIDALYKKELEGVGDIKFQINDSNSNPNCWLFTFRTKKMRELLNYLNSKQIQSRPFWTPMNKLPMYKDLIYINENDISNKIFKECISIPSSSNLTIFDQNKVIVEIIKFYKS